MVESGAKVDPTLIGELRGEVSALVRSVDQLRQDFRDHIRDEYSRFDDLNTSLQEIRGWQNQLKGGWRLMQVLGGVWLGLLSFATAYLGWKR